MRTLRAHAIACLILLLLIPTAASPQQPSITLKPDLDRTMVTAPPRAGEGLLVYLLDEDFEGSFPPGGWVVVNPDSARTWSRTTAASGYGNGDASARMNFYDYLPNEGQIDSLLSPIITGLTSADSLSFDYAYCAFPNAEVGPDTVELYLSTDGGTTFPYLVAVLSTADSTAPTNINSWVPSASEWGTRRFTLPAGAVGGSVQLLFVAHNHYAQNFYIDNIRIGTRSVNDVGPTTLNTPSDGGFVVETLPFTPQATFTNLGTADQLVPFEVRYQILDTAGGEVYSSTRLVSPLNGGSSLAVSFDPLSGGLPAGSYLMRAITALAADEDRSNDTLPGTFIAEVRVATFPYAQDFEGEADGGWGSKVVSGTRNDWVRGTPAKPVQLRSARSGVNSWVTKLDTVYSNSHNAALYSPFFDLSGATPWTILEFYQNFRIESGWDAGVLEYTTNFGSSWIRMDATLGQGPDFNTVKSRRWYNNSSTTGNVTPPKWSDSTTGYMTNDSGWIRSTTSLAQLAGEQNVRFRWRFRTDGSNGDEGWAIDDIGILEDSLVTVMITCPQPGWNLLSLPVQLEGPILGILPCMAFSYVFPYGTTGYQQEEDCPSIGVGFWAKCLSTCSTYVTGPAVGQLTVPVSPGWNIVGGPPYTVDPGAVISDPPGIVASGWYGYDDGYVDAPQLLPGRGYWVKASGAGTLLIPAPVPLGTPGTEGP